MKNNLMLHLPFSPLERRLDLAAYALVAIHFLLAAYYYTSLPATIPVHFNAGGNIDRFAAKTAIFQLPAINLFLCLVLSVVARFPHKFKYRQPITAQNAEAAYREARRILGIVNVLDGILFLLLTVSTLWASHSGSLVSAIWVVIAMLVITPWLIFGKTDPKTPVSN